MDGLGSKNSSVRVQCENALRGLHAQALPLIEAKLATNDLPAPAHWLPSKQLYADDPEAKKNAALLAIKSLKSRPANIRNLRCRILATPGAATSCSTISKGWAAFAAIRSIGDGGDIGPDLTGIRTKLTRAPISLNLFFTRRN